MYNGEYVGLNVGEREYGACTSTYLGIDTITTTGISVYNHTLDFTLAAGADGVAVIVAMAATNDDISSVVLDPSGANVSMSKQASSDVSSNDDLVQVWSSPYVPSGSITVRVTLSANGEGCRIGGFALFECMSMTAADVANNGGFGTSVSDTLDVPVNGTLISGVSKNGTNTITMSGVTEDSEGQYNTAAQKRLAVGHQNYSGGSAGLSVGGSWSGNAFNRFAAAAFR